MTEYSARQIQGPDAVLHGKTALVTGAGSGLGEATALALAEAGVAVAAVDISLARVEQVVACLDGAGGRGLALRADISDPAQVERAVQQAGDAFGRIDFLINNAGVDHTLPITELSVEQWDQVLGVNLRGAFLCSKAVFPLMQRQGGGHIVSIASTAAKRAWANASAYHASKWGLLGLSHALHVEARPLNVRVTAVVAGGMRTPFLLDRFPDLDPAVLQDPKNVAETIRFVLTQPDETVIPEVMVLPMRETSWP